MCIRDSSTPLSLADESLWLLKYTDLLVKIACKFVSVEDAVQQFKDLLQAGDEAGKTYVERGVRLCGKAARVIGRIPPSLLQSSQLSQRI